MGDINWVQVTIGALSGGAVGAIITNVVTTFRARRQPVGRRLEVLPIFRTDGGPSGLDAKIAMTDKEGAVTFDNLFIAEIQIVNKGNADYVEFELGVTLQDKDSCIHIESTSVDRHHLVAMKTETTPRSPKEALDISLKPFNRGDSYQFKLYIVVPEGRTEPGPITLSTPKPVNFVDMPTAGEIALKFARETTISLAPTSLGPTYIVGIRLEK